MDWFEKMILIMAALFWAGLVTLLLSPIAGGLMLIAHSIILTSASIYYARRRYYDEI